MIGGEVHHAELQMRQAFFVIQPVLALTTGSEEASVLFASG